MTFGTFLTTFGVAGAFLMIGAMVRTLWISDQIRAVATWLLPLLFMGGIGAFVTSYHPVVEPLWLHYVLIVLCPFAVGYVGLALLLRGRGPVDDDVSESTQ